MPKRLVLPTGPIFRSLPLCPVVWLAAVAWSGVSMPATAAQEPFDVHVSQLVRQLGDDAAASRDAAEKKLLELGAAVDGRDRQRVLDQLPKVDPQMPADVRHRLARIRETLATALAEAAVAARRVTLDVENMPLSDVLAAIEKQTGNRCLGQKPNGAIEKEPRLTIRIEDQLYWQALDAVLDQAALDVRSFSGEDALAIGPRPPGIKARTDGACYAGPFRFLATEVFSRRDLRRPGGESLRLTMEIAWEPRLCPIRLALPMSEISATDGAGAQIAGDNADGVLNAPVQLGNQAVEMEIPLELPDRSVQRIESLRGKLHALVPGRVETFRFDKLAETTKDEQRRGGVVVAIDRIRKNNAIWEVHMRLRFDQVSGAFASHLGWMLQNETYLEGEDGKPIDHLGYETTRQTEEEIGLAYLFELPEGKENLDGVTWVYKTPAAIVEMPVVFELKQIALP